MELRNQNIMSHSLGPFGDFLLLRPISVEGGTARIELPIREAYHNPFGFVHCGVIYSLVEYAMGYAVQSLLAEGEISATIQAEIQFLSGVRKGTLLCNSRISKKGRNVVYLTSSVECEGKPVAESHGTYFIRGRKS